MSEENQTKPERLPEKTEPARPPEKPKTAESEDIQIDPSMKTIYADGIHSISLYHGNVRVFLYKVLPQPGKPTTGKVLYEIVMPLSDFVEGQANGVRFMQNLVDQKIVVPDTQETETK